MCGQPRFHRCDLAIRKQRHHLSPLQIADNRAIAMISAKSPIIDADSRRSLRWRAGSSPHDAQKGIIADWQHQPLRETGPRPATKRQAQNGGQCCSSRDVRRARTGSSDSSKRSAKIRLGQSRRSHENRRADCRCHSTMLIPMATAWNCRATISATGSTRPTGCGRRPSSRVNRSA